MYNFLMFHWQKNYILCFFLLCHKTIIEYIDLIIFYDKNETDNPYKDISKVVRNLNLSLRINEYKAMILL